MSQSKSTQTKYYCHFCILVQKTNFPLTLQARIDPPKGKLWGLLEIDLLHDGNALFSAPEK